MNRGIIELVISATLLLLVTGGQCPGATAVGSDETTLEAEKAASSGWIRRESAWASDGAYMAATKSGATLEFELTVDRPTTVLVLPAWWAG